MSREREITKIKDELTDYGVFNPNFENIESILYSIALYLVDNGIGSKDRFTAYESDDCDLIIEPVDYREEK